MLQLLRCFLDGWHSSQSYGSPLSDLHCFPAAFPAAHEGENFLASHLVKGRVRPLNSLSTSTISDSLIETSGPPTIPKFTRHLWQFSYLMGFNRYPSDPVDCPTSSVYALLS